MQTDKFENYQLGTTAGRHSISRSTYNMSIDIYVDRHTHYVVDQNTVCQVICMSTDIHALVFLDRHTVRNIYFLDVLFNAIMEMFLTKIKMYVFFTPFFQ